MVAKGIDSHGHCRSKWVIFPRQELHQKLGVRPRGRLCNINLIVIDDTGMFNKQKRIV